MHCACDKYSIDIWSLTRQPGPPGLGTQCVGGEIVSRRVILLIRKWTGDIASRRVINAIRQRINARRRVVLRADGGLLRYYEQTGDYARGRIIVSRPLIIASRRVIIASRRSKL